MAPVGGLSDRVWKGLGAEWRERTKQVLEILEATTEED
jgi:hypothetical protein